MIFLRQFSDNSFAIPIVGTDGYTPVTNIDTDSGELHVEMAYGSTGFTEVYPVFTPDTDWNDRGYYLAIFDAGISQVSGLNYIRAYSTGSTPARPYTETVYILPRETYDAWFTTGTQSAMFAHTADGVTLSNAIQSIMSVLFGETTISGNNIQFKKRDGSTTKVQVTMGSVSGQRTDSVIY